VFLHGIRLFLYVPFTHSHVYDVPVKLSGVGTELGGLKVKRSEVSKEVVACSLVYYSGLAGDWRGVSML